MIRLVARCDDAGSARSANLAIRQACTEGCARNISLMAITPEIEHARDVLGDLDHVDFGLHLSLNCEWEHTRWPPVLPAAQVPGLVREDGMLWPAPKDLHERQAPLDQLLAETRAQLARLRELGFAVAYLDEHCGVGWVNGLKDALVDFCRAEGLVYRPDLARAVSGKVTGTPAERLAASLPALAPGDYLFIGHPAFDDEEMRAFRQAGEAVGETARSRLLQGQAFTDPGVLNGLRQHGIVPTRYSEL